MAQIVQPKMFHDAGSFDGIVVRLSETSNWLIETAL